MSYFSVRGDYPALGVKVVGVICKHPLGTSQLLVDSVQVHVFSIGRQVIQIPPIRLIAYVQKFVVRSPVRVHDADTLAASHLVSILVTTNVNICIFYKCQVSLSLVDMFLVTAID